MTLIVGVVGGCSAAGDRDRALHTRIGMAGDRADEAQAAGRNLNVGGFGFFRVRQELGAIRECYVMLKSTIVDEFDRRAPRLINLQVIWLKA